jgi:hypothetical protein
MKKGDKKPNNCRLAGKLLIFEDKTDIFSTEGLKPYWI